MGLVLLKKVLIQFLNVPVTFVPLVPIGSVFGICPPFDIVFLVAADLKRFTYRVLCPSRIMAITVCIIPKKQ